MNEAVSLAKTARESLGRGLDRLQQPGFPPALIDVAEPIAEAMGMLHQLESSQGSLLQQIAPAALKQVQHALDVLQSSSDIHPEVDLATEAVAGCLFHVHTLGRRAEEVTLLSEAAAPVPPVERRVPQVSGAPGTPKVDLSLPRPSLSPRAQNVTAPLRGRVAGASPAQRAFASTMLEPEAAKLRVTPEPPSTPGYSKAKTRDTEILADVSAHPGPADAASVVTRTPSGAPLEVEVPLGSHTSSNFYLGFGGLSVLEEGGIFVATYAPPEVGRTVQLRVRLPGGYHFTATGLVQWIREAPKTASLAPDSPPGYGASLSNLSDGAEDLIGRYAKNREPLLHD